MSSKIECKSRTLFIRTEMHLQARLLKPRTLLGPHRKGACQVRLTLTLVLYSARIKRICEVRLTTNFVLHSARTQNAHAEERCLQVSYSPYGTYGKLTCRVSLTATFAPYLVHTKRRC